MEILYKNKDSGVCWERVSELFEAVGWGRRSPGDLKQAFEKSTYVRIAYHRERIVGVGRTVDDGRYYGMIVDLVVDPDYQRKGIGSTILEQLREEMAGFLIISLTAAPDKYRFYLERGWKRSKSAFHWPGRVNDD